MAVTIQWSLQYNHTVASPYYGAFQGVCSVGNGIVLAVTYGGYIYRSTDNGVTWAYVTSLPVPAGTTFSDVKATRMFSPGDNIAFVCWQATFTAPLSTRYTKIMRTLDAGSTWTAVFTYTRTYSGPGTGFQVTDDYVALTAQHFLGVGSLWGSLPIDPPVVYGDAVLLKSLDGGASWSMPSIDIFNGLYGGDMDPNLSSIARLDSGRLVVGFNWYYVPTDPPGGYIKLAYSDDDGASWALSGTLPGNYPLTGSEVSNRRNSVVCDMGNGVVLTSCGFMSDLDIGPFPTTQVLWIWRSIDYGMTWTRIPLTSIAGNPGSPAGDNVFCGSILKLAPNIAVLGYGYEDDPGAGKPGWFLTVDNGVTWIKDGVTSLGTAPAGVFYTPGQMCFASDGSVIAVACYTYGASSDDEGEIWRGIPLGLPLPPGPLAWPDENPVRPAQPTATKFTAAFSL